MTSARISATHGRTAPCPRYALWPQKLQIKEEGFRRPQDAKALSEARRRNSEKNSGNLDSFKEIYHSQKPTSSQKNSSGRPRIISVEVEDREVNLKARPKTETAWITRSTSRRSQSF